MAKRIAPKVGNRVRMLPSSQYVNQCDGTDGTIIELLVGEELNVRVLWDCGHSNSYKYRRDVAPLYELSIESALKL